MRGMLRMWALMLLLTSPARADVELGTNATLGGRRPFPDDAVWNTDISKVAVDPSSDGYIASIGADAPLRLDLTIPYVVVAGSTPRTPVTFEYFDESDRVLYPIPADPPIEKSGDRHLLIIDRDNWKLFELYATERKNGIWIAGSGAVWDLGRYEARHAGWTSADAAGLPIFPGLVRADEVLDLKEIKHALRFTVRRTRRAYVYPATHWASRDKSASLPPMGLRVRLKAQVDISKYPRSAQVILRALQRYGMILADNGGDWFVSGAPDARWNEAELESVRRIKGKDLEVVLTGNIVTE